MPQQPEEYRTATTFVSTIYPVTWIASSVLDEPCAWHYRLYKVGQIFHSRFLRVGGGRKLCFSYGFFFAVGEEQNLIETRNHEFHGERQHNSEIIYIKDNPTYLLYASAAAAACSAGEKRWARLFRKFRLCRMRRKRRWPRRRRRQTWTRPRSKRKTL